jgi:mono/diheme cytochrome c family protein
MSNVAGSVETLVAQPQVHPPMGRSMSDRQIAGVLTYLRNSFGNEASAVQPEEIERIRNELK